MILIECGCAHSVRYNGRIIMCDTKSINLLLASEILDVSDLKWDFSDLRVLARKHASLFAHRPQVSGFSFRPFATASGDCVRVCMLSSQTVLENFLFGSHS